MNRRSKQFTEKEIFLLGKPSPQLNFSCYSNLKTFDNGKQAYLCRFIYTTGILFDLDESGIAKHRWCYDNHSTAVRALKNWDGTGKPKNFIKQKY